MSHEMACTETADVSAAAHIKIDYEEIMADTEPDQPGGRIVYSSADYATDEEADAALEAFIREIVEAPYEED